MGIGGCAGAHNGRVEQPTPDPVARRWTVVVPVKATSRGKSRIQLAPPLRRALARALATDTLTGVLSARRVGAVVVVLEDDADGAALHRDLGRDRGPAVDRLTLLPTDTRELNAAIGDGLAVAGSGPVAVLPADLPGVTGAELDRVLAAADDEFTAGRAMLVVPDRQGSGTTLLAGSSPAAVRQRYGRGSFAAHLAAGGRELIVGADSPVRRDVDTVDDLLQVRAGRTAAVAVAAGLAGAVGELAHRATSC